MKKRPFSPEHFLGYVSQVTPQFITIHFPSSGLLKSYDFIGEKFNAGLVGEFAIIEDEKCGFLGRINEVYIAEKEREGLSESNFKNDEFQPVGKLEVLLAFDHYDPFKVKKGLTSFPRVGSKVYTSSPSFVSNYVNKFGIKASENNPPIINLGSLISSHSTKIGVSQQALFGRHCAIVGTTGGGKSWTTSKLIEEVCNNKTKSILIDATGEYSPQDSASYSYAPQILGKTSYLDFKELSVEDLFVLFRPSGQLQQPILLEAIRSLKLVTCLIRDKSSHTHTENNGVYEFEVNTRSGKESLFINNGVLIKQNQATAPVKIMSHKYSNEIDSLSNTNFDINKLVNQIVAECYYDNGDKWSNNRDERNFSNSTSLLLRIAGLLNDQSFQDLFGTNNPNGSNVIDIIDLFLKSDKHLLRISFESVTYDSQLREIMANAIADKLLIMARSQIFNSNIKKDNSPVILFVDEAHQFTNKVVADEYFQKSELNAFDLIAKECRKYGLFLCLSTQLPRDIPIGTLSQMGTFIAHRLINYKDKEAVANACSSANQNALNYLPILGEGEILLTGIDFPMPLLTSVSPPAIEPDSGTPKF